MVPVLALHIPDGFINAPIAIATALVSVPVITVALRTARERLDDRQVPLVGVTAAFVFAVQMINFPIGLGTTGHLLGGALAAILLGPWMASLVLAVVLLVQGIGFADGGITALGANISMMGILTSFLGYGVFRLLARLLPRTRSGVLTATALTSWVTVVAAAAVASLYITFFGVFGAAQAGPVFATMIGLHLLIGIGEAAITTAAVAAVMASRPDLMHNQDLLPQRTDGHARPVSV